MRTITVTVLATDEQGMDEIMERLDWTPFEIRKPGAKSVRVSVDDPDETPWGLAENLWKVGIEHVRY